MGEYAASYGACPNCGGNMHPMGKSIYNYCTLCGALKIKKEHLPQQDSKTKAPE